ncbi:MAG: hypothetical protein GEV28_19900 [Actinophytocola sp.]|uniref:hypothetical protein n=1 Tax=Actinophytocola sp. TaxID=1872138 RepID=UPI0013293513|nr:hypothetical protein [Actinophytocola sp.]MPZ82538.1 hypothetical protein [Actinophytocola sp.]
MAEDVPKPARRGWRKAAVAFVVFVLISLGVGPRVVDYFFDDALDSIADQLGSVEIETGRLAAGSDPLVGQSWAFAEPAAIGPAPVQGTAVTTAVRDRGVPVVGTTTQFIVRSNRANGLIITDMRARVIERGKPFGGTLVLPAPTGGPTEEPIVMARFTVGGADPRAYDGREPTRLLFADAKLRLDRDQVMILQVTGVADGCYCEWVVDIEVAVGTDVRTITVPDVDSPLRLTAAVPRYHSVYLRSSGTNGSEWQVTAVDPVSACRGDCVANPPPWSSP